MFVRHRCCQSHMRCCISYMQCCTCHVYPPSSRGFCLALSMLLSLPWKRQSGSLVQPVSLYRVETCKVLYYSCYRLRLNNRLSTGIPVARSSQPPAIATSYCSLWHTLIIDHQILYSSSPVSSEHSVTRSRSSDKIDSDYF